MSDLILPRRQFLKTLSGIIAAPAIVRADSLMNIISAPNHPRSYGAFPDLSTLEDWRYLIRVSNMAIPKHHELSARPRIRTGTDTALRGAPLPLG